MASAQVTADVSIAIQLGAPPGAAISSVDVFYDQLAPYGVWASDPRVGAVFIPSQPDYVPYQNGYWQDTDVGMVWISSEPFASVTSHYGRWFFSDIYRRWVWMPDTTWGPSWVEWHEAGDDFGWVPLAPAVLLDSGYTPPLGGWHYCPAQHLVDRDVSRWYVPRDRVALISRESRPIQAYATIDRHRVVAGPAADALRRHHVRVQPQRVQARAIGRMAPQELQRAVTQARQRRPRIEQENQQRLQAHPDLRAAQQRAGGQHPLQQAPRPQQVRPTERPVQPRPDERVRPQPQPQPQRVQPRPEQRVPPQPAQPQPRPEQRFRPHVQPSPQPQPAQRPQPAQPEPQRAHVRSQPEPHAQAPAQAPPRAQTRPQPHAQPRPQAQPQPHAQAQHGSASHDPHKKPRG